MPRPSRPRRRAPKLVVPAPVRPKLPSGGGSAGPGPRAQARTQEKAQLLRTLSEQIAELREMNVDILARAAFIQAALDTLLTIHAGVDAGTRELYASYFFSSRETIAAGMRH